MKPATSIVTNILKKLKGAPVPVIKGPPIVTYPSAPTPFFSSPGAFEMFDKILRQQRGLAVKSAEEITKNILKKIPSN